MKASQKRVNAWILKIWQNPLSCWQKAVSQSIADRADFAPHEEHENIEPEIATYD